MVPSRLYSNVAIPVLGVDVSAAFYTQNSMCTSIHLPQDVVHRGEADDQFVLSIVWSSQGVDSIQREILL